MDHKKKRAWFECFITIIILIMITGIPYSFGASAKGGAEPPKLPISYNSAEELFAALAKLPSDQRQEAILAGARKEGKVVHYGATNEEVIRPLLADFEQRYPGVKVEYLRLLADEVVLKALTEVRADRWYFDSLSIGPGYNDFKKANALAKHYLPRGNYPKWGMGEDWYATQFMPLVIAYNTNMLKASEAPKSYKDLLDPKWKGKVAIDTSPDNLIAGMIKKWGKGKTEEWLDKFVNGNKALLRKGHTVQTKLLIAGEFPVASEIYAYQAEYQKQSQGVPIEWIVPEDLCQADVSTTGISRRAPHPYAALLWSQYFMSKEGQQVYGKFILPIHPEAEPPYPRLKLFLANPDRLAITNSSEESKPFAEANELINKYISPRMRGGS